MCTPNYVLTEQHTFGKYGDKQVIEAGTFIRPIELRYVPKHVTEDPQRYNYDVTSWKLSGFEADRDVYCYTPRHGIVNIPRDRIRRV